jgi:hypothetical protein
MSEPQYVRVTVRFSCGHVSSLKVAPATGIEIKAEIVTEAATRPCMYCAASAARNKSNSKRTMSPKEN